MRFLGRLKETDQEPGAFASQLESFIAYLRDERGLSPSTIRAQRWQVDSFLKSLPVDRESFAELTIVEVDNFLSLQGKRGWGRVSVTTSARALRYAFSFDMRRLVVGVVLASLLPSTLRVCLKMKDFPLVRAGTMFSGSLPLPGDLAPGIYATTR
jgi:hypothetical protein